MWKTITETELSTLQAETPALRVLDVRTPPEYAQLGHIAGSELKPLQEIEQWAAHLKAEEALVLVCQHGVRSQHACQYLENLGFSQLYNLEGGMAAWQGERA